MYDLPQPVSQADLDVMRRLDRLHLEHSFMGARMLRDMHNRQRDAQGQPYATVEHKHVTTLMRTAKYEAVYLHAYESAGHARSVIDRHIN